MAAKPETDLPKRSDEFSEFRHPDDASFDRFVRAIDRAYHRPWIMFWRSVLHGIGTAIGATVGAGLVFAALFYVLNTLDFTPFAAKIQELIIPEAIRDQLNGRQELDQSLQEVLDRIEQSSATPGPATSPVPEPTPSPES